MNIYGPIIGSARQRCKEWHRQLGRRLAGALSGKIARTEGNNGRKWYVTARLQYNTAAPRREAASSRRLVSSMIVTAVRVAGGIDSTDSRNSSSI